MVLVRRMDHTTTILHTGLEELVNQRVRRVTIHTEAYKCTRGEYCIVVSKIEDALEGARGRGGA